MLGREPSAYELDDHHEQGMKHLGWGNPPALACSVCTARWADDPRADLYVTYPGWLEAHMLQAHRDTPFQPVYIKGDFMSAPPWAVANRDRHTQQSHTRAECSRCGPCHRIDPCPCCQMASTHDGDCCESCAQDRQAGYADLDLYCCCKAIPSRESSEGS